MQTLGRILFLGLAGIVVLGLLAAGGAAVNRIQDPNCSNGGLTAAQCEQITNAPVGTGVTSGHPADQSAGSGQSQVSSTGASCTKSYTVKSGDTLGIIAANNGFTDWRELWYLNKATVPNPDVLTIGQVLCLGQVSVVTAPGNTGGQASANPPPPEQSGQCNPELYALQPGDTIESVAKAKGISTDDLRRWNA
jgi:LysM repeat protein